ncbi:hypothetical protein HDU91_007375 [Kappamyces sp. JEL0680]|nr:hypothetical protein HDU91_007375 [Kappamyces sp. JEL0680]
MAGHKGEALAGIAETLQWRQTMGLDDLESQHALFQKQEESGKIQARKTGVLKEKLSVVLDITGTKMDKQLVKMAAQLVPLLQKYYPGRLSRLYLFPTNTLFWMSYKMSSYILDPNTIPKLHLKESPASLAEWIPRQDYFTKYGGLAHDPYDAPLACQPPVPSDKPDDKSVVAARGDGLSAVLKSAPIIEAPKYVEELFVAPLEFHNI